MLPFTLLREGFAELPSGGFSEPSKIAETVFGPKVCNSDRGDVLSAFLGLTCLIAGWNDWRRV